MDKITKHSIIEPDLWGKDHWSLLLYIESCVVDHKGELDLDRIGKDGDAYPVRLNNDTIVPGKSELDCLEDLEKHGFITIHSFQELIVDLTDKGWRHTFQMRRNRSAGIPDHDMKPMVVESPFYAKRITIKLSPESEKELADIRRQMGLEGFDQTIVSSIPASIRCNYANLQRERKRIIEIIKTTMNNTTDRTTFEVLDKILRLYNSQELQLYKGDGND